MVAWLVVVWLAVGTTGVIQKATPDGIPLHSHIQSVTIFSNGARVHQTGLIENLPVGEPTTLIFSDIPRFDQTSLSVSAGHSPRVDLLGIQEVQDVTINQTAEASLIKWKKQLQALDVEEEVNVIEKKLLNTLETSTKEVQGFSALNEFLDWYVERRRKVEATGDRIMKEKAELGAEIQQARSRTSTKRRLVEVKVILREEGPLNLTIGYLVRGATWSPVYDLRVSTVTSRAELVGHAKIIYDGKDVIPWENVKVELSTGDPIMREPPQLTPWRIQFEGPHRAFQSEWLVEENPLLSESNMYMADWKKTNDEEEEDDDEGESIPLRFSSANTETTQQATADVFTIPGLHTIYPGIPVNLPLVSVEAPCHFRHEAVPKLSPHTFLKIKLINPSQMTLLPGTLSVYLDNTFVTTTQLDTVGPSQEFWAYLGTDGGIWVNHRFIQKEGQKETSLFTSEKRKIRYHYRITLKNMKGQPQEVVVWDQLPLSQDKEVVVEVISPLKGPTSGWRKNHFEYLEWMFQLGSGEEVVIDLQFTVQYPKGREVVGL